MILENPLPDGWRDTLASADHAWISKALFRYPAKSTAEKKIELKTDNLQLWMYPPQPSLTYTQIPRVDRYFSTRLLVWMPKRLWKVQLVCLNTDCRRRQLTHAGLYPRVRQVLDICDYYNLVTEYLECLTCGKKYIGWSQTILSQLDIGHRYQFPAILTYR